MANDADEEKWRRPDFRQKVTSQIDEALRKSGNPQMMAKNAADIERDVFSKAKSRDEYMCYVARVLVFAKDLSTGRGQAPGLRQGTIPAPGMQQMGVRAQQMHAAMGGGSQALRSPYNVTQMNTVSQPITPVVNAQYQPQTNAAPMQFKNMQAGMVQNQPSPINTQQVAMTQGISTQQQQFPPNMTAPQAIQVQNQQQQGMMGTVTSTHQQHPLSQMNMVKHSQPSYNSVPHSTMQYTVGGMQTVTPSSVMQTAGIRGPASNPSPANPSIAQSPAAAFNPMHSPAPTAQHGMTPSPQSFIAQSPAPNSAPTPGIPSVQSPSILNGPASVGPPVTSPAPMSAAEEQAYLEKHKQLSVYIEPLTRMINRMNRDQEHNKHSTSDLKKLKNFLDILENPARRVSLNVLERCEQVLKKLNLKPPTRPGGSTVSPSPNAGSTGQITVKSGQMVVPPITKPFQLTTEEQTQQLSGQALLETVVKHLKSPLFSHTLKRTFSPIVQSMEGPPICPPPPPNKKLKITEVTTKKCSLPHTLQGELARLCDRFTVKPEVNSSNSQSSMLLMCSIHDDYLPAVPPIEVTVPQNYPHSSPECKTKAYESTPFLIKIRSQLSSELRRMPGFYSVTSLLNAWESSIRLACLSEVTVN